MKFKADFYCYTGSDAGWGKTGGRQSIAWIKAGSFDEAFRIAETYRPGGWKTVALYVENYEEEFKSKLEDD